MSRRWIIVLAVVVALVGGIAAFALLGDDDDDVETTATTTETTSAESTTSPTTSATTSSATSSSAPATTAPCPAPGAHDPVDTGIGSSQIPLTAVDVTAVDACTDRIEFSFESTSGQPGVQVSYQQPPFTEDGSGEPVTVEGSAFLVVRFEPATTFDIETGEPTYDGPDQIVPVDTRWVREVRLTGSFEGVVNWLVGLDAERGFTVDTASNRVTITIA
jgi:hypothetical protein